MAIVLAIANNSGSAKCAKPKTDIHPEASRNQQSRKITALCSGYGFMGKKANPPSCVLPAPTTSRNATTSAWLMMMRMMMMVWRCRTRVKWTRFAHFLCAEEAEDSPPITIVTEFWRCRTKIGGLARPTNRKAKRHTNKRAQIKSIKRRVAALARSLPSVWGNKLTSIFFRFLSVRSHGR